jgi:RimJ/RimL family protein N-acetyltransferase
MVTSVEDSLLTASPPVAAPLTGVTTDRLDLRPIDKQSVALLEPVFAKLEVFRYPFNRAFTRAETEAFVASQIEHWDTLGFGLWMVSERDSPDAIGFVGLSVPTFFPEVLPAVEVGWRLDPRIWGRGYATEAAQAALRAAFEVLRLSRVISLPQTENPPSVRVAERIGMRRECTAIAPATDRRGPVEVALMAVSKDEWASRLTDT